MSVRIMTEVWSLPADAMSTSARLVLLALADHSNDDGLCWPSRTRLARMCGLSPKTITDRLRLLEERGYIARKSRYAKADGGQKTTLYIVLPKTKEAEIGDSDRPDTDVFDNRLPEEKTIKVGNAEMTREEAFETLWVRYPKRDGKKAALRHFCGSVKTDRDFTRISRALDAYISHLKVENTPLKYTKTGSTWFNNWEDWLDAGAEWSKTDVEEQAEVLDWIDEELLGVGHGDS